MNCEAGLVNRMKYRWVGILLHSDLKGEKVLGLACKQAGLSAELVQSRVLYIFLISPVYGFLEVPSFTHSIQEQVTSWPKCSVLSTHKSSLQVGMPEAEEPRSCFSLKRHRVLLWRPLTLPACSPVWAVRLTSLAGGHPSSAAHMWQLGRERKWRDLAGAGGSACPAGCSLSKAPSRRVWTAGASNSAAKWLRQLRQSPDSLLFL